MRAQDTAESQTPAAAPAPPATDTPTSAPPIQRRTWTSGAFLAAAARLVARGEETTYTLRRVVEWATAATGAKRAILWAIEGDTDQPLTMLAWAATDGWHPGEAPAPRLHESPSLLRATRSSTTVLIELNHPMEQAIGWGDIIGGEPIAICAAISGGEPRGILAVAGGAPGTDATAFEEDARAALAACAALAAIVFERRREDGAGEVTALAPVEPTAAAIIATPMTGGIAPAADPYLSLPDRAAILARLGEEIGRARRFSHPLALLLIDADRIGEWVGQAGASAIPTLLAHLVEVIGEAVRDVDLIGRGDDDEFILILPVSEVDDALRLGEQIRATLEQRQPGGIAHAPHLRLTISGGAVGYPDDGISGEELLNAAERTVLYAKRMGRDQIRLRGLGELESPSSRAGGRAKVGAVAVPEGSRITQVFQGLLDALATAGDAHDQARPGHSRAVGRYARALAEACGLDAAQARTIELAGILHDAGKIGLPEAILGKRGTLTPEERAILREQPAVGKLMLMQVPSLEGVIPLVEYAHERYDGNGYPAGLRGNQIPFGSRIIALAEGYEAMTSDRPYRRALSHSMAITELWREAGGRYDPRLVDIFVRLVRATGEGGNDIAWDPALLEQVTVEQGTTPEDDGETVPPAHEGAATAAPTETAHEPVASGGVAAHDAPAEIPITEKRPDIARSHRPSEVGQSGPVGSTAAAGEVARPAPPPTKPEIDTSAPTAAARAERIVRDNAPPAPARATRQASTGPLPSRQLARESLAANQTPPARRHQDRDDSGPDQPSVDDTLLLMSRTTLSRMAELDRLNKRRTGPLHSQEEAERDEE